MDKLKISAKPKIQEKEKLILKNVKELLTGEQFVINAF